MRYHQDIDRRSILLAQAIVEKIEKCPECKGHEKAIENCRRWIMRNPSPAVKEWEKILKRPWSEVKKELLDESENGKRLRQSSPFCGILTSQERWRLYKEFSRSLVNETK